MWSFHRRSSLRMDVACSSTNRARPQARPRPSVVDSLPRPRRRSPCLFTCRQDDGLNWSSRCPRADELTVGGRVALHVTQLLGLLALLRKVVVRDLCRLQHGCHSNLRSGSFPLESSWDDGYSNPGEN